MKKLAAIAVLATSMGAIVGGLATRKKAPCVKASKSAPCLLDAHRENGKEVMPRALAQGEVFSSESAFGPGCLITPCPEEP